MEDMAKRFASTELKIKELTASMKTLKEEKDVVSDKLKDIMLKNNIECISLGEYNIVMKNTKQYGSLNKEYLETSLSTFCNTPTPSDAKVFATKATEHLLNNREVSEKQVVRLLKSKR